jgi:hypothetical protein
MREQMGSDKNLTETEQNKKKPTGNKTILILISCWFLFYIFISLNGGGG